MKGSSVSLKGPLYKEARAGNRRLKLFHVDVDIAKDTVIGRLTIEPGQRGSAHWPLMPANERGEERYGRSYFLGLTAEEKKTRGDVREWVKIRERNEPIDTRVYAYAAMRILSPAWGKIRRRMVVEQKKNTNHGGDEENKEITLKVKKTPKLKFSRR